MSVAHTSKISRRAPAGAVSMIAAPVDLHTLELVCIDDVRIYDGVPH